MAVVAVVGVVAAAAVDQDNVDTNPEQELLVVLRPLKELGHGKRSSDQAQAFRSAEERWFILGGLSPQLTAPKNPLHPFESGNL